MVLRSALRHLLTKFPSGAVAVGAGEGAGGITGSAGCDGCAACESGAGGIERFVALLERSEKSQPLSRKL